MQTDKKVAAVTGSRRGIGFAVAQRLLEQGYFVVVSATAGEIDARQAMDSLRKISENCVYIQCDISDERQRENLIESVSSKCGRLDVLVNNAGVAPAARMDLLETTQESYDRVLDTNLKGTFFMCQLAANAMIRMRAQNITGFMPRIINIGSISSYVSSVNRGEYCISKAGISMVTKLFADRLAEYGIPVFEVSPGIIETDMISSVKEKYIEAVHKGLTPIGRLGQPKDIADSVLALCSGMLDFATGQVINADGGFHIRRL
jgi:NAD(P)-dependent dehydrogenase (short-subunit alcohol dehydrogenase family)